LLRALEFRLLPIFLRKQFPQLRRGKALEPQPNLVYRHVITVFEQANKLQAKQVLLAKQPALTILGTLA
jgi:hypothetical protein